jgi:hypothetical protein
MVTVELALHVLPNFRLRHRVHPFELERRHVVNQLLVSVTGSGRLPV